MERWWSWLGAGVARLRHRYGVVSDVGDHPKPWRWWEGPGWVQAIAIALAWEESLDLGGDSIPVDPRYAEAFYDYLWKISSRERCVDAVGVSYLSPGDHGHDARLAEEGAMFITHVAREVVAAEARIAGVPALEAVLVGGEPDANRRLSIDRDGDGYWATGNDGKSDVW